MLLKLLGNDYLVSTIEYIPETEEFLLKVDHNKDLYILVNTSSSLVMNYTQDKKPEPLNLVYGVSLDLDNMIFTISTGIDNQKENKLSFNTSSITTNSTIFYNRPHLKTPTVVMFKGYFIDEDGVVNLVGRNTDTGETGFIFVAPLNAIAYQEKLFEEDLGSITDAVEMFKSISGKE